MGVVSVLTCNRTFLLDEAGKTIPSNMFWGTYELRRDGEEVCEIAPAVMLAKSRPLRMIRRLLGTWAVYVIVIGMSRRQVNRLGRIYTISHVAAMAAILLGSLGLIKARVSLLLIGTGAIRAKGPFAGVAERWRQWAYARMNAIIFTTRLEQAQFEKQAPDAVNAKCFPFGIDLEFYRSNSDSPRGQVVLVIGNDQYRDWAVPVQVARKCPDYEFRFITRKQNLEGAELPPNIRYLGDPPFAVSRDEFLKSKTVLICSRPSPYFSGNTTLFAAMAAGAVVVADEDKSATDCQLRNKENWMYFARGDVDAAITALNTVMNDCPRAEKMAAAALSTVQTFSMERFARSLSEVL